MNMNDWCTASDAVASLNINLRSHVVQVNEKATRVRNPDKTQTQNQENLNLIFISIDYINAPL